MPQDDGRKSRWRDVTTMTYRSNHIPTFTRIETTKRTQVCRRIFFHPKTWGTIALQVNMIA